MPVAKQRLRKALPLLACRKSGHCPFAFFMPNLEDLPAPFFFLVRCHDTESWKTDSDFERVLLRFGLNRHR